MNAGGFSMADFDRFMMEFTGAPGQGPFPRMGMIDPQAKAVTSHPVLQDAARSIGSGIGEEIQRTEQMADDQRSKWGTGLIGAGDFISKLGNSFDQRVSNVVVPHRQIYQWQPNQNPGTLGLGAILASIMGRR